MQIFERLMVEVKFATTEGRDTHFLIINSVEWLDIVCHRIIISQSTAPNNPPTASLVRLLREMHRRARPLSGSFGRSVGNQLSSYSALQAQAKAVPG